MDYVNDYRSPLEQDLEQWRRAEKDALSEKQPYKAQLAAVRPGGLLRARDESQPVPRDVVVRKGDTRIYNEYLLLKADDEEWMSTEQFELTPDRIVSEILRFVDVLPFTTRRENVRVEVKDRKDPPLFSVGRSYELKVEPRFTAAERPGATAYFRCIGLFYLDTRLQLDVICSFLVGVKQLREAPRNEWVPASLTALAEFVGRFIAEHHILVDELIQRRIHEPFQLARATNALRRGVDVVYRLVEPFRGETSWSYATIEKLWAHVFSFTVEPLAVPDTQGGLLREMQCEVLDVFLFYVCHLYSFGTVPEMLDKEFMFTKKDVTKATPGRRVKGAPSTSLAYDRACLDIRPSVEMPGSAHYCRFLASDALLAPLLSGAQTRARLGELPFLDRSFVHLFEQELLECGDTHGGPLSEAVISSCLAASARKCTRVLTAQFMREFTQDDRLLRLLRDMRSIYCGHALFSFAAWLRAQGASQPMELRLAFARSLEDGGIEQSRIAGHHSWSLSTDTDDGNVRLSMSWPLPFLVHPGLLSTLGECRHFLLKMLRCQQLLIDVQSDTSHPVPTECARPFLLLLQLLLRQVGVISELFHKKLSDHIDCHFAKMNQAETVDAARASADSLHALLTALVGRQGLTRLLHELVDLLCNMTDEIQLSLLGGTVSHSRVSSWLSTAEQQRSLLRNVGSGVTSSVLNALAAML